MNGFYIAGALENGGLTGSKDPRNQVHTTFSIISIQVFSLWKNKLKSYCSSIESENPYFFLEILKPRKLFSALSAKSYCLRTSHENESFAPNAVKGPCHEIFDFWFL
jgi:hypothetical protein